MATRRRVKRDSGYGVGGGGSARRVVRFEMGGRDVKMVLVGGGGGVAEGHIRALLEAWKLGVEPDEGSRCWVMGLRGKLRGKLEELGLVHRLEAGDVACGEVLERVLGGLSELTERQYRVVWGEFCEFVGEGRGMRTLEAEDLERFRGRVLERVSAGTANRMVYVCRSVMRRARDQGLVSANVFGGVAGGRTENRGRMRYVEAEVVERVAAGCFEADEGDLGLAVLLTRFGGLRCPSEVCAVRGVDVDMKRGRLTVGGGKTGGRVVPLDRRLRDPIMVGWDDGVLCRARGNLHERLTGWLDRLGVEVWPRLFHNLRASCGQDWADKFPIHAVASWMGHSVDVASRHYLQVSDRHFEMASA